jgi:hypothetical protein
VVKTLLGSIDPVFDTLDEKRHESAAKAYTASVVTADAMDACCNVM